LNYADAVLEIELDYARKIVEKMIKELAGTFRDDDVSSVQASMFNMLPSSADVRASSQA
jgi:hypothetical protein